jgi:serine protease
MARFAHAGAATLAALALAACSPDLTSPTTASDAAAGVALLRTSQGPEQVVAGEVIVALRAGADYTAVATRHGMAVARTGYRGAFAVLRTDAGAERAAAHDLSTDANVRYAEPNYLRQPTTIDSRLWAFRNPGGLNMKYTTGRNSGSFLPSSYASTADADEDNIEGYAAGGTNVVVGSIDTGVDFTHPEFKNADGTSRLIAGNDWYSNDANPADEDGHGTHTTGTMIGNTVGIAGVSGAGAHVKVYVQRVCGKRGCPTSAIVSAIRAAADYGVVAMNLSLGGSSESQAEADAIAYATSKNAIVVASAGNDGTTTVSCPACDINAISVAATTWADKLAPYSNQGAGLDISAPGGSCYSNTTPDGCIYSAFKGGGYEWEQGTSMAAPQVTGTAAIVASVTGLRGSALRDRLTSTADDIGASGYDTQFGAGRVNSYRAVTGSTLAAGQ